MTALEIVLIVVCIGETSALLMIWHMWGMFEKTDYEATIKALINHRSEIESIKGRLGSYEERLEKVEVWFDFPTFEQDEGDTGESELQRAFSIKSKNEESDTDEALPEN